MYLLVCGAATVPPAAEVLDLPSQPGRHGHSLYQLPRGTTPLIALLKPNNVQPYDAYVICVVDVVAAAATTTGLNNSKDNS